MKLPESVKEIRRRFLEKFPVPQIHEGMANESGEHFEQRVREWTTMFAEQVRYLLPDGGWGCKNAGGGRPRSKDVLAHINREDGKLIGWDLFIGTGTGRPQLAEDPDSMDLTGQVFEPVNPVNHLATTDVTIPEPTIPAPPVGNPPTREVLERLASIEAVLGGMLEVMNLFNDRLRDLRVVVDRVEANQEQLVYQGSVCRLGGAGKLFPVKL